MRLRLVAVLAAVMLAAPAFAQTLQKIKETGVITLGHRESSDPFSYYDAQQKVVGYSHDFQLKVVEAVKKKLNLPNLTVKYVPVTPQTRIPLIQNGTVDIECGSTTNNLERQKQVDFTTTIFVVGTRLLTKKDSGVKDFPDLKGKNVVTTAGTTSEKLIRAMNDEKKMGMSIISAKDHGEAFLTLQSGRAVAWMMDDALLAGNRAKARNADEWVVVGTPQSKEAYGCMVRKGDAEFKKVADEAIAAALRSDGAKEFQRWFESPIPPNNFNLKLPLSEDMKDLFKNPNDKAFQ